MKVFSQENEIDIDNSLTSHYRAVGHILTNEMVLANKAMYRNYTKEKGL